MKSKTIEVIKNYLLENPEERLQICKEQTHMTGLWIL